MSGAQCVKAVVVAMAVMGSSAFAQTTSKVSAVAPVSAACVDKLESAAGRLSQSWKAIAPAEGESAPSLQLSKVTAQPPCEAAPESPECREATAKRKELFELTYASAATVCCFAERGTPAWTQACSAASLSAGNVDLAAATASMVKQAREVGAAQSVLRIFTSGSASSSKSSLAACRTSALASASAATDLLGGDITPESRRAITDSRDAAQAAATALDACLQEASSAPASRPVPAGGRCDEKRACAEGLVCREGKCQTP